MWVAQSYLGCFCLKKNDISNQPVDKEEIPIILLKNAFERRL